MTDRRRATADPSEADLSTLSKPESDSLELLTRAILSWTVRSDSRPLERWLARELDSSGMPIRLPISLWVSCLNELGQARQARPDWSEVCHERIGQFFESVLRFSRPDGSLSTLGAIDRGETNHRTLYREWASAYSGTGAARVTSMWFPRRDDDESSPPPLPAWSSPRYPLAVLRADWLKGGDFLAIDHRSGGPTSTFELLGAGTPWLGPEWTTLVGKDAKPSRPRLRTWHTSYMADCLEWTFRAGDARLTRTAVLLRGSRLAIFADQVEFARAAPEKRTVAMSLMLDRDVQAQVDKSSRAVSLRRNQARTSANALPLALPSLPYATDRGSFEAQGDRLVLTQPAPLRRAWLPVLISWDGLRNRKTVNWRGLTVSERSRICTPEVAFAARVRWGSDETFVIYRSLGKPGLRAFLGHQTRARFLVGSFSREGTLKPILSLD